jgi:hypothetical protein
MAAIRSLASKIGGKAVRRSPPAMEAEHGLLLRGLPHGGLFTRPGQPPAVKPRMFSSKVPKPPHRGPETSKFTWPMKILTFVVAGIPVVTALAINRMKTRPFPVELDD